MDIDLLIKQMRNIRFARGQAVFSIISHMTRKYNIKAFTFSEVYELKQPGGALSTVLYFILVLKLLCVFGAVIAILFSMEILDL